MTEILSPAGNYESFISAVQNGADAIYMGIDKFNARKMANNFNIDKYIECIEYAHLRGVRIYLTLNVLLNDDEIKEALEILIKLYSKGLDAVIVQDIGLIDIIKKVLPNLDIHASTQMSVHSLEQVKVLENLGIKRVVLARELSIDEIKYICDNTSLEIEIFVHGALCVSYSGQCLMSSMIGDRSANKGMCAATCRMKYTLSKNSEEIAYGHLLSKKDIYGLEHIKQLSDIGVHSLKIEGRNKSPEYVGLVTHKYKESLGLTMENDNCKEDENDLMQMFNRAGKSFGYFNGPLKKESISTKSAKNTGLLLGSVLGFKNKFVKVKLLNDIDIHDGIEIFDENNNVVYSTIITCIRDEKFNIVNDSCRSGEIVYLGDINKDIKYDSNDKYTINKTSSNKLNQKYTKRVKENLRKVLVPIEINIYKDSNITVNIMNETLTFEYIPQEAINKEIDYLYLENAICKSGVYPFDFEIVDFHIDEKLYIPISKLNELRNICIEYLVNKNKVDLNVDVNYKLLKKYLDNHDTWIKSQKVEKDLKNAHSLYIYKLNKDIDYSVVKEENIYIEIGDILRNDNILTKLKNKYIYIVIPNIVNKNLDKYIKDHIEILIKDNTNIKGIVLGNLGYINIVKDLKEKYDILVIADYYLNINNTFAVKYYKNNSVDIVTVSNEIEESSLNKIKEIINVEIIDNYITTMTTRFCLISSFTDKCNCNEINNIYTIKDDLNAKYYVISDSIDCISRLVKQFDNKILIKNIRTRRNSLFG